MTDKLGAQNESLDISHWTREEQIALINYLIESWILPKDDTICRWAIGMFFKWDQFSIPWASGKKILYRKPIFKDRSPTQIDAEKYILEFTARWVNISTWWKDDETHWIWEDTSDSIWRALSIEYPDWVKDFFWDTEDYVIKLFHNYVFHPDIPNKWEVTEQEYTLFLRSLILWSNDLKIVDWWLQTKVLKELQDRAYNTVWIEWKIEWISIKNKTVKIWDIIFRIYNRDWIFLQKVEQESFFELTERKILSQDMHTFRLHEAAVIDRLTKQLKKEIWSQEGDIIEITEVWKIEEFPCTGGNIFTSILSLKHNWELKKIRLGKHWENVYINLIVNENN